MPKKDPFTSIIVMKHMYVHCTCRRKCHYLLSTSLARVHVLSLLFLVHLNFKEYLEFLFNFPLTTTFRKEGIDNDKAQYFQKQNK